MVKRLTMIMAGMLLSTGVALAQSQVSGTVVSQEDGEPVVGAAIKVVGTNAGTVTDVDGHFTLNIPGNEKRVTVSYIGMQQQELTISNNMKVVLKPDNQSLDEVVVVAYGTAKRQSITGSIAQVNAEKIENRISTSVTAALEGTAPGVQVNNSYGEPGSNPKIRIRGVGSLVKDAQEPLYIVDGTAYDGNISELNPNDIESMSVLKDAASAALYGNRAANGVVLITTKRGKGTAKPAITLKVNHGFYTRGIKEYDRLEADQWMEASWQAMKNYAISGELVSDEASAAAYATEHLVADYTRRNIYDGEDTKLFDANGRLIAPRLAGYGDLDWEEGLERTGHRQEYNLSGSAAGEKFNVYSSVGYLKEDGYVKSSGYERFSGRLNSQYTANSWLKMGANLSGSYSNHRFNDNAKDNAYSNPFYTARYMAPVYPYYMHQADGSYQLDENGVPVYDTTSPYLDNRNIVYELDVNSDKRQRSILDGQAWATVSLPYSFSVTIKGNFSHANENRKRYDNPNIGDGASSEGRLTSYAYVYNNYTAQELLNWEHDYGMHHVDAMVGHENYQWKGNYTYGMNTNMAVEGNLTMGNFLKNSYLNGYAEDYKTESYLGRVRYNYDEKYFVDFSYRRDGSSRFKKGKRWGDFFSFGVNWNAKKENFLKDVSWVDQLRVRASYGEVGNDAGVSYYGYQSLYYIDKNAGYAALRRQSLSADNIKWETAQTFDLAVEGQLFHRLNFTLGYFDKRNKDLLFQVRKPLSAGSFGDDETMANLSQYQNIGTISNRGVEISLNADIISNNDWTWNLGVDATFLSSKIKKLPGGKDILHGLQNYSEGHDPYEFYTYHFAGVDQMNGYSLYTIDDTKKASAEAAGKYVEINGKGYTYDTTYGKRDWAGSAAPDVYGSFSSNLRWKDLSLNMLFTYSLGGKVYDGSYQSLMSTGSASTASALHSDVLKSWSGVPAGMTETSANRIDPNGLPLIDFNMSTYTNANSDRWLTSASYFVFKNITLTYNLPKTLIRGWGLTGVALTAGVENALTFTSRKGLNPQYSFNGGYDDTFVTARVFNLGVSVNF